MKFGFDIDDTLIDLRRHAFHLYNKKLNKTVTIQQFEEIPTVEIHRPFGLTDAEGGQMWKEHMEQIYFSDCPSYDLAKETLRALEEAGHEIYYITSRPKHYCAQTRQWMIEQGYPVKDGHFFCGMQDDEKIATIKELNLDYYVDDKPAVLFTLGDVKTKVIVKDQSYNRQVELPRLTNWSQFQTLINEK